MPWMPASPTEVVTRCEQIMAHAWMVRTFVKHSPEVDDFPELMGIVRSVFDTSRALETRVASPAAYLRMLGKKLGKMRAATEQFALDAPLASTHTNFQQAVVSMRTCVADLAEILATVDLSVFPPAPETEHGETAGNES